LNKTRLFNVFYYVTKISNNYDENSPAVMGKSAYLTMKLTTPNEKKPPKEAVRNGNATKVIQQRPHLANDFTVGVVVQW